jgi:hypothetical protein
MAVRIRVKQYFFFVNTGNYFVDNQWGREPDLQEALATVRHLQAGALGLALHK